MRVTRRNLPTHLYVLTCVSALAAGCATLSPRDAPVEAVSEASAQQEKNALVQRYEQTRSAALYQAALSDWRKGDTRATKEALQQLLHRAPDHQDAQLLLADVYLLEDQPLKAQAEIQAVLARDPNHAQALHAMAMVLESVEAPSLAREYYRRAAEAAPANEVFRVSYQGPTQESQETRDGTDDAESAESAGLMRRASQALAAGQTKAAMHLLRTAMATEPQNPQIPLHASLDALRRGQTDFAVTVLREASKRFAGNAAIHRVRGLALYRQGEFHASQVALQQALSLDNSDALAYFLMGFSLQRLGQEEAAERHFRQARQLDPSLAPQR